MSSLLACRQALQVRHQGAQEHRLRTEAEELFLELSREPQVPCRVHETRAQPALSSSTTPSRTARVTTFLACLARYCRLLYAAARFAHGVFEYRYLKDFRRRGALKYRATSLADVT